MKPERINVTAETPDSSAENSGLLFQLTVSLAGSVESCRKVCKALMSLFR